MCEVTEPSQILVSYICARFDTIAMCNLILYAILGALNTIRKGKEVPQHIYGGAGARGGIAPTHS
jgi:hypothetical protein